MKDTEILTQLSHIFEKLDKSKIHIENNQWDDVGKLFSEVNTIQEKIKRNNPSIEALIESNHSFKKKYHPLKKKLMKKIETIISSINEGRLKQIEKISGSRNILDNISKYHKPSNQSYYIDVKE